jgi:hypothetical protein
LLRDYATCTDRTVGVACVYCSTAILSTKEQAIYEILFTTHSLLSPTTPIHA